MSNKLVLPFAEIMITQSCNLSCAGCSNYSDLSHKGLLSWDEGRQQIEPWLERLEIPDFGIMGGEPLLNTDVRKWLKGIRELMPNSQIRFTTNGLLLSKNLDIVDLCYSLGNVVFKITQHQDSKDIDDAIEYIERRFDWRPVQEFGIDRWATSNNFRLQINKPKTFIKTYAGPYEDMKPYNRNPVDAFEICCQQTCPLIYQGKLYKCSTSGLLEDTLTRFNNPNYAEWEQYITAGITPLCTDAELKTFVDNFGKPHATCGQCPSRNDHVARLVHYNNIDKRKYV